MRSLQDTYSEAVTALMIEAHAAEQETARVEALLDKLRYILREDGLGVDFRTGARAGRTSDPHSDTWHRVTLTSPSGGAVVVGQVKETSDLTIERLHEIVGTPFFVRSVGALAAQAARDSRSERRAGLAFLSLAGLALLVCGVLYAVV